MDALLRFETLSDDSSFIFIFRFFGFSVCVVRLLLFLMIEQCLERCFKYPMLKPSVSFPFHVSAVADEVQRSEIVELREEVNKGTFQYPR